MKLHTLVDMLGNIPCFVRISHGRTHDVAVLDRLPIEPGSFYVIDRGYVDFRCLHRFTTSLAFCVGSYRIPGWCDQEADKRAQKALATGTNVVAEFEEPRVQRQVLLRDPSVGAEPTAQQRPESFHRVNMHFVEPVSVIIPGVLALAMADGVVGIAPFRKAIVDVVLIGVDHASLGNRRQDQRADRDVLNIG